MAQHEQPELADDGESSGRRRPGLPVDPARITRVVRTGRWWLLGAAIVGVVLGVALAKLAVAHTYDANASLRFEGVQPLAAGTPTGPFDARRDLPSRVEALRVDEVVREVRARMGLESLPLAALHGRFESTADAESGLVTITTHADSPTEAARFANTIVDVFLEHQRARRLDEIEREVASLEERIQAARTELDGARATYDAFRAQHGVTNLTSEQEAALARAAELRAQADLANAEVASLEARVRELRDEVRRQPRMQVVASQTQAVDETELARAEAHLSQLRGQLAESHPRLQAAERQTRALRERVVSGAGSTVSSVSLGTSSTHTTAASALATASADLEAARQRAEHLARLASQAQDRVASFSTMEGDAARLLADVQVKETLLTELQNQRARLASMRENPDTGFTVLARAVPPESAVRSKRKQIVAASVPIAVVALTFIGLLVRELRGLKLHTAAEIAFWGNGPVVGSTTWPRDPRAAGDLVADMDDFVPRSSGTMLVVGATEQEAPLAAELAKQLAADWIDGAVVDERDAVAAAGAPGYEPSAGLDPHRSLTPSGSAAHSALATGEAPAAAARARRGGAIELLTSSTPAGLATSHGMITASSLSQHEDRLVPAAWEGPLSGQPLRRAARLADRVLVVVHSGAITARELAEVANRLGRSDGVGYAVVGVSEDYASLPDRSGDVEAFWSTFRE